MEVGKREDALAETIDFPISIKKIKEVTNYLDTKVVHKQWEVMFEDAKHTRKFTDIHWGVLRMVVRLYHNTNGLMTAGKMHEIIKNLYMQTSKNKRGANIKKIKGSNYNVRIIVNDKNQFDKNGKSTEKYNSTEVDVFIDGELSNTKRIGGTRYRTLKNIGKEFKGYEDSLGFVHILDKMETGGNIDSVLAEYKKHIDKDYKDSVVRFKNDKSMLEMFKKDKADHYSVMEYMKAGNWDGAYKEWAGMDTASREEITNKAYELLNEKNGYPTYAEGTTIKGFTKDKTILAFGQFDFEQIGMIWGVDLFGLDDEDTENLLDELRGEWRAKSKAEREEILNEYGIDKYANGSTIGGGSGYSIGGL